MDINTLRGLATLVALIAFLLVTLWAYSSKRKSDFNEAASLPFADDPVQDKNGADVIINHHTASGNRGEEQP